LEEWDYFMILKRAVLKRVLLAKIEFIRENGVEATQSQQWSLMRC